MKRIYFASDMHLGARYIDSPSEHEKRIIQWLDSIKSDAEALYLLGDIFDYWFEYKSVVPKGFVRFLAKIAELTDAGVDVHFFTGNHDVWMFDYLPKEIGVKIHTKQIEVDLHGKKFVLGHGDDIGHDRFYHLMLWCFHNKFLQACYRWLHPDIAGWIADTWSYSSRMGHFKDEAKEKEPRLIEQEHQVMYAKQIIAQGSPADYIIFGHRHEVFDINVGDSGQRLLVIGDWIKHYTYAVFDGTNIEIKKWQ